MPNSDKHNNNERSSFRDEAASLHTAFCLLGGNTLYSAEYNNTTRRFSQVQALGIDSTDALKQQLNTAGGDRHHKYLSVANKNFTIVPEGVFTPENKSDYLHLIFDSSEIDSKQDIRYEAETGITGTRFIYAVDENISKTAASCGFKLKHALPAHLKVAEQHAQNGSENQGFIFLYENFFYLALFNGAFLMCNTFPLKTNADLGYYTLFTMEQFNMKGSDTVIHYCGQTDQDAAKTKILDPYVKKLSPLSGFVFAGSDQKNNLTQSRNFTLYSQLLCA